MIQHDSVLEGFCKTWEETTGLRICIYDLGYFSLDSTYLTLPYTRRIHCSTYCELIKTRPDLLQRCIETESWRIEQASQQQSPFVHECYAGVSDLVVPIRVGTTLIGAVFLGQCRPTSRAAITRVLKEIVLKHPDFDTPALRSAITKLPSHPSQGLEGMIDVATLIAEYIRQNLNSIITETKLSAHLERDSRGNIIVSKIPNYFLNQLKTNDGLLKQALVLIRNNYWRDLPLPEVARNVGLSVSHFSRLFHKTFGLSYRRCIVEARLSAAGWLFQKTDLKIKEIANILGYSDVYSLSRAFRIHGGITLRSMRNRQPLPWHMGSLDILKANSEQLRDNDTDQD